MSPHVNLIHNTKRATTNSYFYEQSPAPPKKTILHDIYLRVKNIWNRFISFLKFAFSHTHKQTPYTNISKGGNPFKQSTTFKFETTSTTKLTTNTSIPRLTPVDFHPQNTTPVEIDASLAEKIKSYISLHHNSGGDFTLSIEDLYKQDLQPKYSIKVSGKNILISKPQNFKERTSFVVYVEHENTFVPRVFYRSNSSSSWRLLPAISTLYFSKGHFHKGYGEDGLGAPAELQKALSQIEQKEPSKNAKDKYLTALLESYMKVCDPFKTFVKNAREEPRRITAPETADTKKRPSRLLPGPESIKIQEGNKPDFSKCIDQWTEETDLYGTITKCVIPSKNNTYWYIFYTDKKGRAGISNIECRDSELTSHGIRLFFD